MDGGSQYVYRGGQKLKLELPAIKYEFNKRNFVVRSLFNYV